LKRELHYWTVGITRHFSTVTVADVVNVARLAGHGRQRQFTITGRRTQEGQTNG
jgi:hypothetical protein